MTAKPNPYAQFDESNVPPHMIKLAEAQTLDGLFRARVRRTPDAEAYRFFSKRAQAWQAMSWQEVATQVARWQTALDQLGYQPGDRVAVMMENCVFWPILDQAALGMGLILVPLYANDRPDNSAYVLNNAGAKFLLIKEQSQADQLERVADEISHLTIRSVLPVECPSLDIVCIDDWLPEKGEPITKQHDPDSLANLVYTSGTTGHPKGVMLSHKNMLWNAWAGLHSMMVYPDDQHLSFLPLSHTLERSVGYYLMMMAGAKVAFNRSIPDLAEDLQIIQPTIMIAVPRIFERVHAKIMDKLEGEPKLRKKLFQLSVDLGWHDFQMQQGRASWRPTQLLWPLLKKLVAGKIQSRLGGRVRIAIVGGAAMPDKIARIFLALGVPILQGYGLTETSPIISVNSHQRNDPKTVGALLRDIEVQIDPDDQELLVKSPGIMQGYWKNDAATNEVIDSRGWLHTGDIANHENGYLTITGRVKDILVLANGEKVPPSDIENAIIMDPLIEQGLIIGEGRPFLGALVVLNEPEKQRYLKKHGSTVDLNEEVKQRIKKHLHDFPGYTRIHAVKVLDEEWTIENELLTPTLKARRNRILEKYGEVVDELYAGH